MKTIVALFSLFVGLQAFASPAEVMIIRHGEKEKHSADLSSAGYYRASELAHLFAPGSAILKHGALCAIYAAAPSKPGGSMRPIETVTPVAQAQNLKIHTEYTKDDVQVMATAIMTSHDCDGRTILIAWTHQEIPAIASAFNVPNAPANWPGSVYDSIWDISFAAGSSASLTTFAQGF